MAQLHRDKVEKARLYLYLLMLAGALFGLVISPPVLSIGLIGIVILGLLDPLTGINPTWKKNFNLQFQNPVSLALIALYVLLLLGFWQTEDWPYYLERLRIKIPLLSLPFVWPGLPTLTDRIQGKVFGGFALFMATVLAGVLVNYGLNFEEINDLVRTAKPVPVPRNHIRFSLLVTVGIFTALKAQSLQGLGWNKAWLPIAAFLFIGLHLLAVRSGLAGAYAGLGVYALVEAWRRGTWWPAAVAVVGLILLPIAAYWTVPSFRTKLQYMRYELMHRDVKTETDVYSDAGRLASIRVGLDVWRDNPIVGVGPGNLLKETDRRYAKLYPGTEGRRPHNQFVSALAGSGLLGGVVTVGAFLVIGFVGIHRRDGVFLAVWSVIILSCLVENTLENTVGVSLVPLFLLLLNPGKRKG